MRPINTILIDQPPAIASQGLTVGGWIDNHTCCGKYNSKHPDQQRIGSHNQPTGSLLNNLHCEVSQQ
ncbi:hypothetical protein IQ264_07815 [Phormidium sp. LEGE 05292]|uniref:hypothetical protein n=1 Tax=[Phormidium] sp. LEGE 05292 TaxID=767427 RepID=UPI00187EAA07|nr:hypothetical protein [Phormidium sp. LEGE 05292]MBE9225337.1 hypothetical protein [Phormidium sp. LEGE 05292]